MYMIGFSNSSALLVQKSIISVFQDSLYLHNGVDTSTIPFPHGTKPGLSPNVPHFYRDISFRDFSHVEANSWNHVFAELT